MIHLQVTVDKFWCVFMPHSVYIKQTYLQTIYTICLYANSHQQWTDRKSV